MEEDGEERKEERKKETCVHVQGKEVVRHG